MRKDFSIREVYSFLGDDLDITLDQFKHWSSNGRKLLRLIYACSIHILPAIAVTHTRAFTSRLLSDVLYDIENALRDPKLCDESMNECVLSLVCDDVIPYHQKMCQAFPDGIKIESRMFGADLEADDKFLQTLFREGFKPQEVDVLPRSDIWYQMPNNIIAPSHPPQPPFIIKTNFDYKATQNKNLPVQLANSKDMPAIHEWTVNERAAVLQAPYAETLEDFRNQLCKQNQDGFKVVGSYVRLKSTLVESTDLLAYGAGGLESDFMFGVFRIDAGSACLANKTLLVTKHTIGFKGGSVDSAAEGLTYDYAAMHLGCWGRRAMAGQNAPEDIHPRLYMGNPYDPNHSGSCPLYRLLGTLQDMLKPVLAKLWRYIPGLMRKQEELSDSLGPIYPLECAPFCMTVLNVQSVSRGHRDLGDCDGTICLILALGDFKGGSLCIYEPGASIDLTHGQFAAIRSRRMVHFNLDYVGERFSYVFTSDNGLERWEKNRNGWVGMEALCSSSTHQQNHAHTTVTTTTDIV
ncbi:DEAD-box ATP-dependent RNA helicase 42 [Ceratobasidium sp. AG-Ba]|nr:DEAD-box ATP-dependent RNA helicase 42 [Ceratobasidium sp. AG-Ba]